MANAREITKGFSYIHANQTFNSTNVSVFINEFFIPDVVSLSYTMSSDKTPIYSYNSEYFSDVAAGNFIVHGVLGLIFTETAYMEVLRQEMNKKIKFNNKYNIETLEKMDRMKNAPFVKTNITTYKLEGLETLSIYDNDNYICIPSKSGNPANLFIRTPFGEPSIYNDYNDEEYEQYFSELEDILWNKQTKVSSSKGYAVWDPLYIRLRNDLELDYEYSQTSDRFIRGIISGYNNPLTMYIIYGNPNDPKSEFTMESIDDIHFRSRSIQIANDGNPVIVMYEFIARSINANINHKLLQYFKEV